MKTKPITKQDVRSAIAVLQAIYEAINAHGQRGVPNGHLWAHLDGTMRFETYTSVIEQLKRLGLVTEDNHLLRSVDRDVTQHAAVEHARAVADLYHEKVSR